MGQSKSVAFAEDTRTFTIPAATAAAAAAGGGGGGGGGGKKASLSRALPAKGGPCHAPATTGAAALGGEGPQVAIAVSPNTDNSNDSSRSDSESGADSSSWIAPNSSSRTGPGRLPGTSTATTTSSSSSRRPEGPLPKSGHEQLDKYLDYLLGQQHPHKFMYYPGWGLNDEGCIAVGEFLRRDSRIKVMTLSGNAIKDDGEWGVTWMVVGRCCFVVTAVAYFCAEGTLQTIATRVGGGWVTAVTAVTPSQLVQLAGLERLLWWQGTGTHVHVAPSTYVGV